MRGKTLFLRKAVEKLLRLGSGSGSLLLGLVCKTSTQARRLEWENRTELSSKLCYDGL